MGFIYGIYYKMGKIYKYKIEMTMPSLLPFGMFVLLISFCIYSNFVRIILQVRAEHLPVHLVFLNTSFVINAQNTPTVGTFPTFHYFQIAIINNAIVNIFYINFCHISNYNLGYIPRGIISWTKNVTIFKAIEIYYQIALQNDSTCLASPAVYLSALISNPCQD